MVYEVTVTRNYDDNTENESQHTMTGQALINLFAKLILERADKEITSFIVVVA